MKQLLHHSKYLIYIIATFLVVSCTVYKPVSSDTTTEVTKEVITLPPDTIAITMIDTIEVKVTDIKTDIVHVRDRVKEDELRNKLNEALTKVDQVQRDLSKLKSHLAKSTSIEVDKIKVITNSQIVKEEKTFNFDKLMLYLILLVILVVVVKSIVNKWI